MAPLVRIKHITEKSREGDDDDDDDAADGGEKGRLDGREREGDKGWEVGVGDC